MSEKKDIVFCTGGGCTAKLGAGVLSRILEKLPRGEKDPNLLVGYDSRDDAAVYQVTEDLALVQTVDFFPPMVDDPYIYGQVAAANALSDVYAMGGEVKTALNLVCFPESMDLNVLGQILQGGAEKVAEAGGILAGGHSIADTGVKYGLSVTGLVNPKKLYANDAGQPGDRLILTKALGVGLICSANRVGEVTKEQMDGAVQSMTTLNKTAAEISRKYTVHACTDVTGFGFLGHLHEMMGRGLSCEIDVNHIPVLPGARESADAFLYTAAGQRNRNYVGAAVQFENVPFSMEEVLFDPQTSGGLLMAAAPDEAEKLEQELQNAGLPARIVGTITEPGKVEIFVRGEEETEMKKVDARGDACPIPVVKAKHAIEELSGAGQVEVLVDNEIAVQNLTKMAEQKGYQSSAKKLADQEYQVIFTVGEQTEEEKAQAGAGCEACIPDSRTDTVVVIANDKMGEGSEELGKTLLKAFTFALTQQDNLPKTILFYNGGASLTCEGSPMLEDLKTLEAEGVEILTCGTCLNFYGLTEKLAVGGVTNMYVIAEKMLGAGNVVKP